MRPRVARLGGRWPIADSVRRVRYCYVMVPNRAGQGASVLSGLREAGVNLIAYTGFPARGGRAQIDLVTEDMAGVRRAARKNRWGGGRGEGRVPGAGRGGGGRGGGGGARRPWSGRGRTRPSSLAS